MGVGAVLALVGPPLFHLAEQLFKGEKLGAHRMSWVQAAAQQFMEFLVNGGKLQDGTTLPQGTKATDGEMKAGLEALFQQAKKAGQLASVPEGDWYFMKVAKIIPVSGINGQGS